MGAVILSGVLLAILHLSFPAFDWSWQSVFSLLVGVALAVFVIRAWWVFLASPNKTGDENDSDSPDEGEQGEGMPSKLPSNPRDPVVLSNTKEVQIAQDEV